MALNYKQLLELELNLNKFDPEFSFVFVSNNLSIKYLTVCIYYLQSDKMVK